MENHARRQVIPSSLEKELLYSKTGIAWKKVGVRPHHGIALPLSSLHSQASCGIGEFYDLIPLISWCKSLKLDLIQLLPLNALGPDFSPYNAISSCALSEFYLSLDKLPFLEEYPHLKEDLTSLRPLFPKDRVVYSQVQTHKLHFLHAYIASCGERLWKKEEVHTFIAKNPWVKPYALFRVFKTQSSEGAISTWAPHLQTFHPKEEAKLLELYKEAARFHILLQYLCFSQLLAVKQHASSLSVHLMGDIPILLSRESVDVWTHPDYFDLHLSAGAPPDFYNAEGQYWGFPVPRIEALRKNHFHWWKQRLKIASDFYDLFRIDHVIGLFHLWSIPLDRSSKEGFYIPKEDAAAHLQGQELLSMISLASRPMLPIGEDLGTVPPLLRPLLREYGVCGTKVMRWEKDWEKTKRFTPIHEYPPVSLTTLSTHDSTTLALWWKEEKEEAAQYAREQGWEYTPEISYEQRMYMLKQSHQTTSLFHVNLLQEYLALFPSLISPHLEQERINIPGKMLETNWTYKFRPSVEEMISHVPLAEALSQVIG